MEDIHSSYLSGQDDVDNLPYPLPSLGQNEACAPMPCPGGVEIVLVGGGEPTIGAYPGETGVLPSYIGYREESRDGMRLTLSRESDGLNCGIMGRPEQDHLSSSKYTLPPHDHSTLHHFAPHQPGTHTTPWRYSDTHEDFERESDGVHLEEQYFQHRRFEWTSGLEDGEGHSQLMMVRSDPQPITMPAFRRALQLGRVHEAWQGGNYSEEDAHVEVEEEEEDEDGSVYTCIECSIYFKKKSHLLEHMFQHSQEGEGEGGHGVEGSYTCGECGKGFGDEESLESHRQLHQESRKKIIEEISKLESFADEGREARLQCPKCLFGTNSSKVFVQHAKTHVKKVGGETRITASSFRVSSEMVDGGETSEPPTEGIWKAPETENSAALDWKLDISQPVIKGPSKVKRKILAREESHSSQNNDQRARKEGNKPRRTVRLPENAVKLKSRFREALRTASEGEGDQRRQLREEVAVVLLENINAKKKRTKARQPWGSKKRLPIKTLFSRGSLGHHLPREDWADDGEDDIPLDTLLTDPKYASQLEALGLRSEERECPYCPDRFHNGIGLANHVRGHLNRVGVSYNVRHFISAEEVKAIEQNYSFQKKRKKVLASDEDDGILIDLGRIQGLQSEQSSAEKILLDQSVSNADDSKGVEGESNQENECQFCGAYFETRKGMASHARAHLRHLGVTDPDAKCAPIATLNSLLKSEAFKKQMSIQTATDYDPLPKAPINSNSTNTEHNSSSKIKGTGTFTKPTECKNKTSSNGSANFGGSHSMSAESALKLANSTGLIETSAHFKSLSGSGNGTQIKIVEAGAPLVLSLEAGAYSKLVEAGSSQVKSEAVHGHSMVEPVNQPNTSIGGLAHPRPPHTSTPPTKKMKTPSPSCKSNMDSYWAQKNASTPLNLSPSSEVVRCEFCGEFFENRKGLSSHARSHLRQMGVTEWHVNGSPIDTLREILASGICPRTGTRIGGPSSEKLLPHHPPASPSGSHPYSGLAPAMQRKPPRLPTYPASDWPSELSPLNLSLQSEPSRDIRCEFCSEFFENRKGLSSHARSHLRQMGITEWHVNGSPIDTLREVIRRRHPATPQQQISNIKKEPCGEEEPPSPSHRLSPLSVASSVMPRDLQVSPQGRPHNSLISPIPTKRPAPHEPRLTQSEPMSYLNTEPKTCFQSKSYIQGESRPKSYVTEERQPKTFVHGDGKPKQFLQSGEGYPKTFVQEGRPKGFLSSENRPKTFVHLEGKPKTYLQGDAKPKSFMPSENKPKPFLQGESKPKSFSPDGKPKTYIQTELPFKVKMKASPEKAVTSMEACCELCGLFFENRKALASHARAHLRQFGVTEWCVNGSPIETLREWIKQRPQKAGAYLSYIQGRPFSKKFKRALQSPKTGPEKESPVTTPTKVAEKEHSGAAPCLTVEKTAEPQGQKVERHHPKPPEVPPSREDTVSEPLPKNEEPRPPARIRPVPSLVPRPPQTSLVKFVGNIYTLKCRFCDTQFQGPLSIQEQWVRHLQHHILQMNFAKVLSPPHDVSSQEQSEAVKSQ
ncbi:protein Wiz-like isoform 2-T2 [Mantella aurantiaca]